MLLDVGGDFRSYCIAEGVRLHLRSTQIFKTVRVDLFVHSLLQPLNNTRFALIARLLECGTQRLPDLRRLNQFVDDLYGALFAVEVDQFGNRQVIHMSLELPDGRFLPDGKKLLGAGLEFLRDVLLHPLEENSGFPPAVLEREKLALEQHIASHFDDRMVLALRRCAQEMCRGEPYSLCPLGDPGDFSHIGPVDLLDFHLHALAGNPIDIYVTGVEKAEGLTEIVSDLFSWERQVSAQDFPPSDEIERSDDGLRQLKQSVPGLHQGKLAMGFRTAVGLAHDAYPALLLLDFLLGGDAHSRLYRTVRERLGLCYHVGTFLEPLCELMFLEAGVEMEDYSHFVSEVQCQIRSICDIGPRQEELDRAKALAIRRLWSLPDDREGLARFSYQRDLARAQSSRALVEESLRGVGAGQVREVAEGLELDTVFFLHNQHNQR